MMKKGGPVMTRKCLLLLVVLLGLSSMAHAGTVNIAWNANTESDLAGYRLYYGETPRAQGAYTQSVTIGQKDATAWTISVDPGVYYFALTAYDERGNESVFSAEVMAEVPVNAPPGKPGQPLLVH